MIEQELLSGVTETFEKQGRLIQLPKDKTIESCRGLPLYFTQVTSPVEVQLLKSLHRPGSSLSSHLALCSSRMGVTTWGKGEG